MLIYYDFVTISYNYTIIIINNFTLWICGSNIIYGQNKFIVMKGIIYEFY